MRDLFEKWLTADAEAKRLRAVRDAAVAESRQADDASILLAVKITTAALGPMKAPVGGPVHNEERHFDIDGKTIAVIRDGITGAATVKLLGIEQLPEEV